VFCNVCQTIGKSSQKARPDSKGEVILVISLWKEHHCHIEKKHKLAEYWRTEAFIQYSTINYYASVTVLNALFIFQSVITVHRVNLLLVCLFDEK
jgi:hypothetical protein